MYLTDHPMAESLKAVNKRSNKNIADLDPLIHQGQVFLFGGYISKLRETRTKKTGALMAFGTLEDETGTIEFVVFPKTYDEVKNLLKLNSVVLLKGKVELRDEALSLLVEKISVPTQTDLDYADLQNYKEVFIPRNTDKTKLQELGKLLKSRPGSDKVVIVIPNGSMPERMVLPYTVAWDPALEAEVQNLLH
jgi:DNA polymerase-3 subunit alpha